MSKVILVTGGSSGIGLAIATALSNAGHIVYGTSRSGQAIPSANFEMLQMDVTDEASIGEAMKTIVERHKGLDVLINNAGLGMAGPIESISDAEARVVFNTNVFGLLNMCRSAAGYLRASHGLVVNITSIGGVFALPFRGVYCASKFAVEGLSEALSMELSAHGVRVVIVQPGDFKTNINANRLNAMAIDREVYPTFDRVLEQVHHEVKFAQDPERIGKLLVKIVGSKRPKLRYRVATPLQRLSILLNRILPGRLFEGILAGHYGVNKTAERNENE
jgi:NAD(P)-dependent dehydrogenase (short-subunit alcohol dehydrogenase family)